MKFGHFDDSKKEYLVETPFTPLPWINYLGNEEFFGMISNTGGGYCFYRDAKLQRLLRYRYNSLPSDVGGRFYYIMEQGKAAWNPTFSPVKTDLDSYICRHGMGYTVFESKKDDLSSKITMFYNGQAGGYRLNTDFKELKFDMGRMFGFAYGEKENGAVFSHMTVMYANALYRRGFAKEGYKALKSLFDTAMDFDTSRIYPGIP